MKKIRVATLTLVFIFTLAGTALAGGAKAPKSVCLNVPSTDIVLSIATKTGGSMKINGNQKVKFYDVQGNIYNGTNSFPIDGSGYMNGDVFHFTFNGVMYFAPNRTSITGDVYFDVVSGDGTSYIILAASGGVSQRTWTFEQVPCSGVSLPGIQP